MTNAVVAFLMFAAGVVVGLSALILKSEIPEIALRGAAAVLLRRELPRHFRGPIDRQIAERVRERISRLSECLGNMDIAREERKDRPDTLSLAESQSLSQIMADKIYQDIYWLMATAGAAGFGHKVFPELVKLPEAIERFKTWRREVYPRNER